jgi:hypothetical protein
VQKQRLSLMLNRNTVAEFGGSLAAALPALNRVAVCTFAQLGAFEQLRRRCSFLRRFYVLCRAVLAGKAMVYSLTYSQLKPACSVARYCSGKFPSAKKYHNCTFKYVLQVVQGEIRNIDFR